MLELNSTGLPISSTLEYRVRHMLLTDPWQPISDQWETITVNGVQFQFLMSESRSGVRRLVKFERVKE